ncbi:hypothetical protein L218DRAFT_16645 [Marasmius fiardii PR-910]|nr:hypothetical protein L218DRAFT_16645 [Marasmius fiardii PR-910]
MSSQKRPPSQDLDEASASDKEEIYASGSGTDGSMDSGDEILAMKPQKSRQTKKRKIRATAASSFGATLQSLLATSVPAQNHDANAPIALLALKPSVNRKPNDEKLDMKVKRIIQLEKEDKGRVKDVIGGWGAEGERTLRKVAQRGVVKLFNYVQESQNQTSAAADARKAMRGSGKPTSEASGKGKDSILGRTVGKEDFFDMIRTGTIVSKA